MSHAPQLNAHTYIVTDQIMNLQTFKQKTQVKQRRMSR